MTYVTCRLTTENRDQLRNPTLRNRVWATFYSQVSGRCWNLAQWVCESGRTILGCVLRCSRGALRVAGHRAWDYDRCWRAQLRQRRIRLLQHRPLRQVSTSSQPVDQAVDRSIAGFCSVLFCSLAVLGPRVGHTMDVYFLHLSLSSVVLIDSFTESPVHVLMLSISADEAARCAASRRRPSVW